MSPVVRIRSSAPDPSNPANCLLTLDVSYQLTVANPFRITVIQAWLEADYPEYWGTTPFSCDVNKPAPSLANLRKGGTGRLPFINIAFEASSATVYTPLAAYRPGGNAPITTSYTVTAGPLVNGQRTITVSGLTASVPNGCAVGNMMRADLWGTRANPNSSWPPQCVNCSNRISLTAPQVVLTQGCAVLNGVAQRTYSLTVVNNITTTEDLNFSFTIYRDNGDNQFNPAADAVIASNPANINVTSGGAFSTGVFPYAGNSGPTADDKLFVFINLLNADNNLIFESLQQACGVLPVRMVSFETRREGNGALLSWETASESENKGFDVQRRLENGAFETIGFVPSRLPNGTGDGARYQFRDASVNNGTVFYRLRQVDLDGKAAYSDIRSLRTGSSAVVLRVFPNPGRETVNVIFPADAGLTDVSLEDMSGKTLRRWNGINQQQLQLQQLQPGLYMLRVQFRATGEQTVQKIVIQ